MSSHVYYTTCGHKAHTHDSHVTSTTLPTCTNSTSESVHYLQLILVSPAVDEQTDHANGVIIIHTCT